MKRLVIFIVCCSTFFISNCSPKLSPYFASTHYVESTHTFIVNDSLKLSLKTPGDIWFIQNKEQVVDRVQQQGMELGNLLAYGITTIPPNYQVLIWVNPNHAIKPIKKYGIVRDTLLHSNKVVVACVTEKGENLASLRSDCKEIFASISTDTNYKKESPSILDLADRVGNRYYQGLNAIRSYPVSSRSEKWFRLQIALTYASFWAPNPIYDKLLDKFSSAPPKDTLKKIIRSNAVQSMAKVKKKLLQIAKEHRIVMFNESHFRPTHRKLITKLLPAFKKIGFTYLALEAVGPQQDSLLNAGHYPTINTGFYTRGPQFAQLIRTAQKLEFTIVAYENTDSNKNREKAQAKNIYARTFAKNDSARVLVLAGWDHILERPTQYGKRRMASFLHKLYNIDPLTIGQTGLLGYHKMARTVAMVPSNIFNGYELNSVDWLLLNNLSLTADKPNYTYTNPFDKTVQIAIFLKSELGALNDYSNRIPYKTTLAKPDETVKFYLPDTDYFMVIFDKEGYPLAEKEIQTEAV